LSGEAIHEVSNVVIQTPPLFDHDQARSGSAIWLGQVAMGLPAVARESHVLSRVGLGHRAPFIAVEDAIHLPFPVLSATIFQRQPESAYPPWSVSYAISQSSPGCHSVNAWMASVCWICRRIPRHPDELRKSTHERPLRQRSHLVGRAAHTRDSACARDAVCAAGAVRTRWSVRTRGAVCIRHAARVRCTVWVPGAVWVPSTPGTPRVPGTVCVPDAVLGGDALPNGVPGSATIPARPGVELVRHQS